MLHNTAVYILPARLYTLRLFISLLLSYILYLLEEEEEEESSFQSSQMRAASA